MHIDCSAFSLPVVLDLDSIGSFTAPLNRLLSSHPELPAEVPQILRQPIMAAGAAARRSTLTAVGRPIVNSDRRRRRRHAFIQVRAAVVGQQP